MTPDHEPPRARTTRACLPIALAGIFVLAAMAIGTIFFARQIEIGPFDEEPQEGIYFITEYDAHIAKVDRTNARDEPLIDVQAILRRDSENYHARNIRQPGDTEDVRLNVGAFATDAQRGELSRAELSIPDALKAQLLTHDMRVRVLVHSRSLDPRLLVDVSTPNDRADKP